jgi:hypothetical protein
MRAVRRDQLVKGVKFPGKKKPMTRNKNVLISTRLVAEQ